MRWQLLVLGAVTFVYTVVFAAVFAWVYTSATQRATERIRTDLDETLRGAAATIDAEELVALYREGSPNASGTSDDGRYKRLLGFLDIVHHVEPRAWPYAFVRGGDGARRVGPKHDEPEFVYVVDLWARYDLHKATRFLSSDTGSASSVAAWERGVLAPRPGIYTDAYGSWMTSYAPIRDLGGHIVAVMGVDFEASYVEHVQREVSRGLIVAFVTAYAAIIALTYVASSWVARRSRRRAPVSVREVELTERHAGEDARERRSLAVLRAELLGVPELAKATSAVAVYRTLGEVFDAFDTLAHRHGLQRIATNAETYAVVGGLDGRSRGGPRDVARLVLDMIEELERSHPDLSLRMGAHVGDVVVARAPGGYEIFGDAVRVTEGLERKSDGRRLLVSRAFADAVRGAFQLDVHQGDTFWLRA